MNIGEKLKALRKERKLTLEDVSRSIDISRANISKYENGDISNIPSDKIELLAKFYDVSPAYLMGWEERKKLPEVSVTVSTDEARILSRGIDRLPKEQREQALAMFKVMFEPQYADLFTKEEDDDT